MSASKEPEDRRPGEHDLMRLSAFVEQRLDAEERRAVVAHVANCAECRTVLANLARAGVPSPARAPRRPASWAAWLPLAASVTIVVGAGWLFWDRRPDGLEPDRPAPAAGPAVTRRGGERLVEDKRFQFEDGVWVDEAYDPFALLPTVDVGTASERDALLARIPALAPFAALGPAVTVVHDGTVYRIDLPR